MPRRAAREATGGPRRNVPHCATPLCSAVPHHYEPRHHWRVTIVVRASRNTDLCGGRSRPRRVHALDWYIQTSVHRDRNTFLSVSTSNACGTARPVVHFVPALVKRMSRRQTRRRRVCAFLRASFLPARKLWSLEGTPRAAGLKYLCRYVVWAGRRAGKRRPRQYHAAASVRSSSHETSYTATWIRRCVTADSYALLRRLYRT